MNRKEFFSLVIGGTVGTMAAGSLLSGCSDLLDQSNPNTLTPNNFWENADQAKAGVSAIYQVFYTGSPAAKWDWEDRVLIALYRGDDIGITHDVPYWWSMAQNTYGASNPTIEDTWTKAYTAIYRANQVVNNVPDISMDKSLKSRLIGEAKFLRAFYYFLLVTNFQNVPIILKSPSASEKYSVAQSSPDDTWTRIEKDLKDAIKVLPATYDKANEGRATKGAALGYLGRSYLYQKKWSDAVSAFDQLISNGHHGLVPEYKNIFAPDNEFNEESLFEISFTTEATKGVTNNSFRVREEGLSQAGGWYECFPNKWLFEEMTKEKTTRGQLDPRVYYTYLWNGSGMKYYGQTYDKLVGANKNITGWMKYNGATQDHTITEYSGYNDRVLRYADVLLMHAEALIQSGGSLSDAKTNIDKVRNRANLSDLPSGMSKKNMLREIEHQRICELADEANRWYDLLRWNGSIDGSMTIKQNLLQHGAIGASKFDPSKNKYFPIPLNEINTNGKIKQNPGY
jgi:hypothetical protein